MVWPRRYTLKENAVPFHEIETTQRNGWYFQILLFFFYSFIHFMCEKKRKKSKQRETSNESQKLCKRMTWNHEFKCILYIKKLSHYTYTLYIQTYIRNTNKKKFRYLF